MELVIPLIEESLQPPAKEYFEEDGLILYVFTTTELTVDGQNRYITLHHTINRHLKRA